MKKIILLLTFMTSFAHAGLYQCDSATAEPKIDENHVEKKISFEKTSPFFVEHAFNTQLHGTLNQKPYLIYYAIDSSEPFMQYSVKYEIAKLKQSCEKSESVNFVAILNSLYVEHNEIILCKNKSFKSVNLKNYKELDENLKAKRNFLREGDHSSGSPGMMKYLVRYKSAANEAFYNYPLAHPDFLADLVNFVSSNEDFFPISQYMSFLNLKSHGSKQNVLSGLYKCQIEAKALSQNAYLKTKISPTDRQLLNQKDYYSNLTEIEKILEQISLGESIGVGGRDSLGREFMGREFMGREFMGREFMGAITGLGNVEGLGTDYSFGTYHIALSSVLFHMFNFKNDKFLGFVMLESCDTNRNIQFHQQEQEYVLGVYSAKHSLWYRNLNWWGILEEANGSTLRLMELLKLATPEIQNIVVE